MIYIPGDLFLWQLDIRLWAAVAPYFLAYSITPKSIGKLKREHDAIFNEGYTYLFNKWQMRGMLDA